MVALRQQISRVLGRADRRGAPLAAHPRPGRDGHRQGAWWPRRSTGPARGRAVRSSTSTARPSRRRSSRPSCSAGSAARSPTRARPRPGLFQAAHGGTIFLDEIGLLPLPLQSKLLKVIEDQQVRRLGGTRSEARRRLGDRGHQRGSRRGHPRPAVSRGPVSPAGGPDASSTAAARARRRRRPAGRALSRARLRRLRALARKTLTPEARGALRAFAWPGNVRQLANVMERAALLDRLVRRWLRKRSGSRQRPATPGSSAREMSSPHPGVALEDAMRDVERARLLGRARGERRQHHARSRAARAAAQHLALPAGPTRARARRRLAPTARRPSGRLGSPRPDSAVATPRARPSPCAESRRLTLL